MKLTRDRLSLSLFLFSIAFLLASYGFAVGRYEIFPFPQIAEAKSGLRHVLQQAGVLDDPCTPQIVHRLENGVYRASGAQPGVNLVTSVKNDAGVGRRLSARIMSLGGEVIHAWDIDWFKIWPDAHHLPDPLVPQSQPGTTIHGATIMENGDLVFNFEALGLVRLAVNGQVVWRLPYQTHHSVHRDERGHLWVCGQRHHSKPVDAYPNYVPPFTEFTVLEVSDSGKTLREISLFELFEQNQLGGLLSLTTPDVHLRVTGDTLHLNDVEPYPAHLEAGFFDHDDVVVSLRNINAVVVFNRESLRVKFVCVGRTVRQHDPDFVDSSTISVLDNNSSGHASHGQSRIVSISAPNEEVEVRFQGSKTTPFYTSTMGKHQWLANGNLLITESRRGRAFEVDSRGEIVWEFVNYVESGGVDELTEVTRLPAEVAERYLETTGSQSPL